MNARTQDVKAIVIFGLLAVIALASLVALFGVLLGTGIFVGVAGIMVLLMIPAGRIPLQAQNILGILGLIIILVIPPAIFMALFGVLLGIGIYVVSAGMLVYIITSGEGQTGGLMAAVGPVCLIVIIFGGIATLLPREIALGIWVGLLAVMLGLSLLPRKDDPSSLS